MKLIISYVLLFFLTLGGCIGTAYHKKIIGNYSLSAFDVKEQMEIIYVNKNNGYMFSIVKATVFAVGYNKDFIIAKQHPMKFPSPANDSITNYYIIPLKQKISSLPIKNVIGPLDLRMFQLKKKELEMGNIDFTIVFGGLE